MISYAQNDVLAGSLDGQKAFADLLQDTKISAEPEVYFLDFASIDVATTSFLRDSVVAYRNHARSTWHSIYPVCANLSPHVYEEFHSFLTSRGDAFVICSLDSEERIDNVEIIGKVDGKQAVALRGVLDLGEVDAQSLRAHMRENVAPTAWNNRLGALVAKGILIEIGSGRNKRYRPVLEGLCYGT
ncbi:MAG: hypothetical protein OXC41_00360 [Gammaproteobacteria bacterium]|nr:hypothetical protein [Gammaproteobacteria bacterium]